MVDLKNVCVLAYIIIGYVTGILAFLLEEPSFVTRAVGTGLICHTIIWSAYMHHEFCHNSVFEEPQWNIRFGYLMDWINGSCYWTFHELKKQHINHHIYKVEYDITSSYLKWIEERRFLKQIFCACEYFYFPINAFIVHWRSILSPWWKNERKPMRKRTLSVIFIRLTYFYSLYYIGDLSLILCYLVAYSISIQITRFTDTFSHDYELVPVDSVTKGLSKQYDILHTYSIACDTSEDTSRIIQYLTRLIHIGFFLNFNFHNQHHYATQKKWFQLGSSFQADDDATVITKGQAEIAKKIDDEFNPNDQQNEKLMMSNVHRSNSLCDVPYKQFTIPMSVALWGFHTHRVTRLFSKPGKPAFDPITEQFSLETCYGVTDAPLLVLEV